MPNTNGILPCVIAIFLCPNPLRPRASRPAPLTATSIAGVHRRAYRRAYRSAVYAGAAGYGYGLYSGYGYPSYSSYSAPYSYSYTAPYRYGYSAPYLGYSGP